MYPVFEWPVSSQVQVPATNAEYALCGGHRKAWWGVELSRPFAHPAHKFSDGYATRDTEDTDAVGSA
jgi:hypothetical protein